MVNYRFFHKENIDNLVRLKFRLNEETRTMIDNLNHLFFIFIFPNVSNNDSFL